MTTLVSIDGVIQSAEDARVSVLDRGFLYGDSVFETVRTYSGRPDALALHLTRLEESARRVLLELPADRAIFEAEVGEILRAANNEESTIRIMVTRGSGPLGLDPTEAERPLRVIIVSPLQSLPAEAYECGVGVVTLATQRAADGSPAVGAKVANYLVAVLGLGKARSAGAHECVIVDARGNVIEGTTSNVFVVSGGVLVTPSAADGPLLGITRGRVLEVAKKQGLRVEERSVSLAELRAASEAFITSTIRELVPVVAVDTSEVGAGVPGPVTRALRIALGEKIRKDMGL